MAWRQAGKEAELEKLSDLSELDMADRRELDDAVLAMLGVRSAKRRGEMIDALYSYLREYFERTRQKEEKAILNKNKAKRQGKADPAEIAAQLLEELAQKQGDLLRRYDPDFIDRSRPFDTFDIPAEGTPETYEDMFVPQGVRFLKGKKTKAAIMRTHNAAQSELIVLLVSTGSRGLVRIPHEEKECRRLCNEYGSFLRRREETIRQMIGERTTDEDLQDKIYSHFMKLN